MPQIPSRVGNLSLHDIPDELLIAHLLPALDIQDVLTFGLINKRFYNAAVCCSLPRRGSPRMNMSADALLER